MSEPIMDDPHKSEKPEESSSELSRRDFIAMSVAAGLAASAASSASAAMPVIETDVEIKTPDGMCDAAFIHPTTGSHPGVLIWTDAFGLRPSMRDIGKRIAAEGYSRAGAQSFLPRDKGAGGSRTLRPSTSRIRHDRQDSAADGLDQRAGRGGKRRRGLHRLPGCAKAGEQIQKRSAPRATAWAARWW